MKPPLPPVPDTTPLILGARSHPLRDIYHGLLRMPWYGTLGVLALGFFVLNAIFAALYALVGGIEGAHEGSFLESFFFSVQTFGTIGYGAMYPKSTGAHVLVVLESIVSLVTTAISTGLIFTKFSVSTARIVFSSVAVVAPMDGKPTLMMRIGNDRGDRILDAVVRMLLVRTERTREGSTFYRMIDLRLARERAPALARSFTLMHPIDEDSPLHGATAQSLKECEAELQVTVSGVDETTLQPVHALHTYVDARVLFDHRFADVLSERPDGRLVLDVRKFHDVVPL